METSSPKFQNHFPSNTAILIVVLFFIASAGSWFFYRQKMTRPEVTPVANERTSSPKPTDAPSSTIAPNFVTRPDTNGATTVVVDATPPQTYRKYSLRIPKEWVIQEGSSALELTISNGDYRIVLGRPDLGGGICRFSDTNLKKMVNPELYADLQSEKSYVQMTYKQGKLRRVLLSSGAASQRAEYKICEQMAGESTAYSIPTRAASITYSVPVPSDLATLRSMDSILSTLNYCDTDTCDTPVLTKNDLKITGTITEADTGCFVDGICQIKVNGSWVILATGEGMQSNRPEESGLLLGLDGISPATIGDMSVGKTVEIYAAKDSSGDLTLKGKKSYYVKLLN